MTAPESEQLRTVFVSSTFLDNEQRRRTVLEAIQRADMRPLGMELMTADERSTRTVSLDQVAQADVYLGILAWRYGTILPGDEKAVAELEYDVALEADKPRLMFLIDERQSNVNPERDFDQGADRWKKQELLESFKQRVRGDQLPTPFTHDDLGMKVMQALNGLKQRAARGAGRASKGASPIDASLPGYLASVADRYGAITLAGFETRLRVPLELDDLYVEMDLALAERATGRGKGKPEAEPGETTVALAAALGKLRGAWKRRQGLVLLGHPGSGKTTQLRRVAYSIARHGAVSLGLDQDVVPLFLPLRNLNAGMSMDELIVECLAELDCDEEFARQLLARGRVLLLADGLDEVREQDRSGVRDWIERQARRKGNLALVSCRYAGYQERHQLDAGRFAELQMRPLDRAQVNDFVRKWYRAVETTWAVERGKGEAALRRAEAEAERQAEDLVQRLGQGVFRSAARVFEMTASPLLLTAICLVDRDRGRLPEKRSELYDECTNSLLQHWREQAKRLDVSFAAAPARQVLQRVAYWMHSEEGRTRTRAEELAPELEPVLREVGWNDVEPAAFLATIRDESGLLTGWSDRDFGFLHLGFQEYLTAHELRARLLARVSRPQEFEAELGRIADLFGSSWWQEVLCLLLAIDDACLFSPLFRQLLRRDAFLKHPRFVDECVNDAVRFDAAPFRERIEADPQEGSWLHRTEAIRVLSATAPSRLAEVDPGALLAFVRSVPGKSEKRWRKQLTAFLAVRMLDAKRARRVAEGLVTHPLGALRDQARELLERGAVDVVLGTEVLKAGARVYGGSVASIGAPRFEAEPGGYELVRIPAGAFRMGSLADEKGRYLDEDPQHEVVIESAFYLGACPVTNEEYARYLAANSSAPEPEYWGDRHFNQPRQPVVGIDWEEAQSYCEWAGLALPTESQWEYACRARTTTRFWSGGADAELERAGWYLANSEGRLHPVGEKDANQFGLFDVHGNVWEWCQDAWSANYADSAKVHPVAYESQSVGDRVVRGGSFRDEARFVRSAYRLRVLAGDRTPSLGFRPARVFAE